MGNKLHEKITNALSKSAEELTRRVHGWYDWDYQYIDDGSQYKAAIENNEDVVNWFNQHPSDIKTKAYTMLKSKLHPSSHSELKSAFSKKLSESVNEDISVFDERHFGKNGIIIMIDDNGRKTSAIFKNKKNADKYNRNNIDDVKKLLDLAKKTPYPKAIDESYGTVSGESEQEKMAKLYKTKNEFVKALIQHQVKKGYDFSKLKGNKEYISFIGSIWDDVHKKESVNEVTITVKTKDGKLHHYPNFKKDDVISFLTKNKMKQVNSPDELKSNMDFYMVESVNEVTVTRIPNFNLESDAYILLLSLLKSNSGFKKVVGEAAEDLYDGGRVKSVFTVLQSKLSKIITPQVISSVVDSMNSSRTVLYVSSDEIAKGTYNSKFAGILALGVVDSLIGDPIDLKLLKDLGNPKVAKLAQEYSANRGKEKFSSMLGNKGF